MLLDEEVETRMARTEEAVIAEAVVAGETGEEIAKTIIEEAVTP